MRCQIASVIVASVLFAGCASNGLEIPGEHERLNKNICSEYYAIAEGYAGLKNYTKAAEYYKLAMRDKNIRITAYYKMGRSYALAKDWDNALAVFQNLQKRDPGNQEISESIAYISAMKGDTDTALLQYKHLCDEYPDEQTILENYIALLITDGKGEIAESELALLKNKFPDSKKISDYADKIAALVESPQAKNTSPAPAPAPAK